MRGVLAGLGLMLHVSLMAQNAKWTDFVSVWRNASHAQATLLMPKSRLKPGFERSDEALIFLSAGGDLSVRALEGGALEGLQVDQGWNDDSHWILLGQDGTILDQGSGLPTGEYLRDRLRSLGFDLTWEALDAFLRLHPDHGAALQRRLSIATRLAQARFRNLRDQGRVEGAKGSIQSGFPIFEPAKKIDAALPDDWCAEVEDTLRRLNGLPDAWRLSDRMSFQFWLDVFGKAASTGLRAEVAKFSESVLNAWGSHPHSGSDWSQTWQEEGMGLGPLWISCETASRATGALPELPLLTPSPGRFWPHSELLMGLPWTRPDAESAQSVLSCLDRLPGVEGAPSLWRDSWSEWLESRSYVAFLKAVTLGHLGRWQEATSAMQECRSLSGKGWVEKGSGLINVYSSSLSPSSKDSKNDTAPTQPSEAFLEVLRLPSLEAPPKPQPPPSLRFIVWDHPEWEASWEGLRASAALAPWSAEELVWAKPRASDTARMIDAGFPASGWAVFQGDGTIVARGNAAPEPTQLAMQLRNVAPSRIHLFDDFLAKHPQHLDARRDRYDLIKARMPQTALEVRLREDAAHTMMPLDFGPEAPWISDLEAWRTEARKLLPGIEAILNRWPEHAGLWKAWIAWSTFLPKPPSVMDFAAGLPVFGPQQAWISRLPAPVHRAVAAECRKARRWGPMNDWFEGAWGPMLRRVRSIDPPTIGERETAIYEGYREALTALKRTSDRAEADRVWAALRTQSKADSQP
ncbi:hypothetical protein GETHLI_09390 [Geothrix limicola]|uniref:Uncharacterized protein n=1 Tax=Geothrix limicola TaxID=2927978 RepID=A0ABQ5QCR3_9BACT|nr:hypothetical protein [Geothrix limicola]GLH72437.1 hypothetical protein GETHLI_09390 [Geothrix limicola]